MFLHLRSALLTLFVLPLLLLGCRDTPTVPDVPVVGTYALQTVGGAELPLLLSEDAGLRLEIIEGFLELTAEGTFHESISFRETPLDEAAEPEISVLEVLGVFSVTGDVVTFNATDPPIGSWPGTAANGTIIYSIQGVAFVFQS